jgi:AraC-like DNA-binding protein
VYQFENLTRQTSNGTDDDRQPAASVRQPMKRVSAGRQPGPRRLPSAEQPSPLVNFEAFRAAVWDDCPPAVFSTADITTFRGRVSSASLGAVALSNITVTDNVVVRRTPRLIKLADVDLVGVGVQLHGSCVVAQDDREALLTPGDYAVWDTRRPYTISTRGLNQILAVMFPREMLRTPPQRLSGLTASRFDRQHGLAAAISPFLVQLGRHMQSLNQAGQLHLADAVSSMLASSFAERLSEQEPIDAGSAALRLRVRAFIEQQLADPSLNLTIVAAAHHISVRYLQKLFEVDDDTVSGWIRVRRLEHCRRELADPQYAQVAVGSIAARWGLVNASHFSRLFKNVYGLSPTEYRSQALGNASDPGIVQSPGDKGFHLVGTADR